MVVIGAKKIAMQRTVRGLRPACKSMCKMFQWQKNRWPSTSQKARSDAAVDHTWRPNGFAILGSSTVSDVDITGVILCPPRLAESSITGDIWSCTGLLDGLAKTRGDDVPALLSMLPLDAQPDVTGQSFIDPKHDGALKNPIDQQIVKQQYPVLQAKLGQGTFGNVYKCRWQGLDLAVKIKDDRFLLSTGSEQGVDIEVSYLKLLSRDTRHPNVVQLVGWGHTKRCKQVLLWFPRSDWDLRTCIRAHRKAGKHISSGRLGICIVQLFDAMRYVHGCQIIHCDLKPANILINVVPTSAVSAHSDTWSPIIADFGNAWFVGKSVNLPTKRFGTLQYTAPEVLLREFKYSYPSDIWSMGLCLAEMEHLQAAIPGFEPVGVGGDGAFDQLQRVYAWVQSEWMLGGNRWALGRSGSDVRILPLHQRGVLECKIIHEMHKRMPACAYGPLKPGSRNMCTTAHSMVGAIYGRNFAKLVQECCQLEPTNRMDAAGISAALARGTFNSEFVGDARDAWRHVVQP